MDETTTFSQDTYALPRHNAETARLNEQHKYVTKAISFLLHPRIPTTASPLRVADIACGSGIWLLDIARQYPNVQGDGFDISGDQFASASQLRDSGLEGRVNFHARDAADPAGPGSEFEGKFDIVAVRFMHINLLGIQWDQAVKNVAFMLKPGGYVQWVDWDPMTARVIQYEPLAPKAGLVRLLSGFRTFLSTRDTAATDRIPQMLAENGVAELTEELYPFDRIDECRDYFTRTLTDSIPNAVRKVVIGMEGSDWDEEKLAAASEETERDIAAKKAFVRMEIKVHVGKKPS